MANESLVQFRTDREGERVDKLVVEHLRDVSRSSIQRMIREGLVTVNGEPVKPNYRVRTGDLVIVHDLLEASGATRDRAPQAESIPLDVVYEDAFLVVVDKPAGMVVHPATGHDSGTLTNAVLAHVPDMDDEGQADRPGIVHRLDMQTSGLIVVAKSGEVRAALQEAFKKRQITKEYLALVEGQMTADHGIIDAAIGRDPRRRKRMSVVPDGRPAVTEYRVLERFERNTYVAVEPQTGRTHQIRVHMAYIGHPVVGDTVYGYRKQRLALERHFLHATRLAFRHPVTEETVDVQAPLPDELQRTLDTLRGCPSA
jgi:23S rRNA pseudouridine1911/1915/1917 synthase